MSIRHVLAVALVTLVAGCGELPTGAAADPHADSAKFSYTFGSGSRQGGEEEGADGSQQSAPVEGMPFLVPTGGAGE